jgi:hypothetical protein
MNRSEFATGILLLTCLLSIRAQTPNTSPLNDLSSFMKSDYIYNMEQQSRNTLIKGSPYLSEEFSAGSLSFRDSYYRDLQLRYNIYEGRFEFKSGNKVLYFDPQYTEVDTVWIGNDTYIFQEYNDKRNVKRSYLHMLYDGNGIQAFALKEITLLQAEQAKGYATAKPARFQQMPDRLFVRFGEEPAQEFSNRRSISKLFPAHTDELRSYAKKERLRFRQPEDLIELCRFYDSLQQ